MADAIKNSCNGFIYRYSTEAGVSDILITSDHFGLGRKSRLAARNQSSIPNPEWLKMQGLQWSPAFTSLVGIGQGAVEISPLQMATIYSTFANGQFVHEPNWELTAAPNVISDFADLPDYKPATFELIHEGLRASVNDPGGTGANANSANFVIAGQTGTVLTGNPKIPVNAWFCGFAPFENPTVAVTVFVKDGVSGNATAAPVAKEVIEFALKNTPPNS